MKTQRAFGYAAAGPVGVPSNPKVSCFDRPQVLLPPLRVHCTTLPKGRSPVASISCLEGVRDAMLQQRRVVSLRYGAPSRH